MAESAEEVGQVAVVGDLVFWTDYDSPLIYHGRVTSVSEEGRVIAMRDHAANYHRNIGVPSLTLLPQSEAKFDFAGAVAALEKRGATRFRSLETARRLLVRFRTGSCTQNA